MNLSITGLLALLLGLVLALGNYFGVDTSKLENLAGSFGIEPMEVSLDGAGLGATATTDSEGDLFAWDDADFDTPWTPAETAQECAEGAGVGTFPDVASIIEPGDDDFSIWYYYADGQAQVLILHGNKFMNIDKAVYAGVDDISMDDRAFDLEWTETIDGVEVQCFGYEEGMACKALFNDGVYVYSIYVMGPDDEPAIGMDAAELETYVSALLQ